MKRLNLLVFPVLMLTLWACNSVSNDRLILDVKEIKGKTSVEVEDMLGRPDTVFTRSILGKKYYVQRYKERELDIRHYQGQLVDVVVNKPFDLTFEPQVIKRFGFEYEAPHSQDTAAYYRWKDLQGIANINVYMVGVKKPEDVATYFKIYFDMK